MSMDGGVVRLAERWMIPGIRRMGRLAIFLLAMSMGDYIKNDVGVDRFNNASRLNAAMGDDDSCCEGLGPED